MDELLEEARFYISMSRGCIIRLLKSLSREVCRFCKFNEGCKFTRPEQCRLKRYIQTILEMVE
ncbi:MAG: hypothetical protein QXJ31_05120 [Candidatus Bathyarchaeia archaeon]